METNVELTPVHYTFIIITILVLIALLRRKEIVLTCIIGIFAVGFAYTHDLIKSIQVLSKAIIVSNGELFNILLVIAVITAMSGAMRRMGVDELMVRPFLKLINGPGKAFWVIGICILISSFLIWPSPAIALVGVLFLPVAEKAGLPVIWTAVAMNIFGHGMALSADFFIQGAPAITAGIAGTEVTDIMKASLPLWCVMTITVAAISYILMLRDLQKRGAKITAATDADSDNSAAADSAANNKSRAAKIIAGIIAASFVVLLLVMITQKIVGSEATALITGTVLLLTCIIIAVGERKEKVMSATVEHLKDGFVFAVRIFAPVIVIAAFFFLGNGQFSGEILGSGAPDILGDISLVISSHVPMNRFTLVAVIIIIGMIAGLDGSGFSGLPLIGSTALVFSATTGYNVAILAALGQITTVFVGGGTIIPWGVVPAAAVCGVSPNELARRNLLPVLSGIAAAGITALFLL